jgi:prolyl-tRNA editing enzyme YbaK/EbsC (Cys-tRNA(Pro) deacylase)
VSAGGGRASIDARHAGRGDRARALGPDDLRAFIAERGLSARLVAPGVPTPTVPAAAEAMRVAPDAILKSLVFLIDEVPTLVVAAGTDRLRYPLLARAFGVSRRTVRLAEPDEALAITGFSVGAMPPFGHLRELRTVLEARVPLGATVYGGGGALDLLLELQTDELAEATRARRERLVDDGGDGGDHAGPSDAAARPGRSP